MRIPLIIFGILICAVVAGAQTTHPTTQAAEPISITVNFVPLANATATIQSALYRLPAGSTLNLTANTYLLTGPIRFINKRGITLNGHGAILKALPKRPLGPSKAANLIAVDSSSDLTIENCNFDGNAKARGGFNGTPQSITLYAAKNILIKNCDFQGAVCDDVFMWGGANPADTTWVCENVRITQCNFTGANRNAISVVGARFVRIDHNTFAKIDANDPKAGIDVEPNRGDPAGITHDVTIDSNTFTDCFQAITAKEACRPFNIFIVGNEITGGTYGINNEASGVRIEWNTLTNLKGYALGSDNGGSGVIQNNTLINCPTTIYTESGNVVGKNAVK